MEGPMTPMRPSPRRQCGGRRCDDAVEYLVSMSQLKLSHDGADVDMSRCLRKVVLVQNALRRSSPVLSRYGLTPLASPPGGSGIMLPLYEWGM